MARLTTTLQNHCRQTIGGGLILLCFVGAIARAEDPTAQAGKVEFFERKIRPILSQQCIECHGPKKQHGGLRLDARAFLLSGGDRGSVIDLDSPQESLLLDAIRHGSLEMPPEKKLPDAVIADFERWIADGAVDPRIVDTPESVSEKNTKDHWSFQKLVAADPPEASADGAVQNSLDLFINAQLQQAGLTPVGAASRRVLIRRATWDLLGLPPAPEEVEAFVKDESPTAYANLIERLLASPHYGERWGRHWLDVVRYADTAGETADFPAPHAWRYRNYVIDSLNKDKPYDQFLREQIAGDILAADAGDQISAEQYAELVTATGYLAISRRFGFNIRSDHYLTLEDTIDTFGKSMLGLTVACARCHDHKYDPIPTADYYGLYGIFQSTKFSFPGCEAINRPSDLVPMLPPAKLQQKQQELLARSEQAAAQAVQLEPEFQQLRTSLQQLAKVPTEPDLQGALPNGGEQWIEPTAAWIVKPGDILQLSILPQTNHGADSTLVEWEVTEVAGAGRQWNFATDVLAGYRENSGSGPWNCFGLHDGPDPFTTLLSNAHQTSGLHIWHSAAADLPSLAINPLDQEMHFITVTIPPKQLSLHPGPEGGVAATWTSPIEGQVSLRIRLADADATGGDGVAWTLHRYENPGARLEDLRKAKSNLEAAKAEQAQLANQTLNVDQAYAVSEGEIANSRIHVRGEPTRLGDEVPRKFLTLFGSPQVPAEEAGSGRRQLAQWLTDPENPLVARVAVNRIWQYHFGQGLVRTPNDFGIRGDEPSHPELLDWLAAEFIRSGWSMKQMHRLIMTSAAYQRAADDTPEGQQTDPENRLLWHFERKRLDAEQIRDGLLSVSGQIDLTPAEGHPFPPVEQWGFTQHTPFSANYATNHRSVYLMVKRNQAHPFLDLFNGADPNQSTPSRINATVPPQALFFLNSELLHKLAVSFADRLQSHSADQREQIDFACRLLYAAPATEADHQDAERFFEVYANELPDLPPEQLQAETWRAYARVLLSSSKFFYVE